MKPPSSLSSFSHPLPLRLVLCVLPLPLGSSFSTSSRNSLLRGDDRFCRCRLLCVCVSVRASFYWLSHQKTPLGRPPWQSKAVSKLCVVA
uniref:Putative secreted protein n=1 Tax=Anopheles marajoara TaxID=58244 RepID=A0A2M4CA20_9DIPT